MANDRVGQVLRKFSVLEAYSGFYRENIFAVITTVLIYIYCYTFKES